MKNLFKYGPLVGSALLVAGAVLEATGQADLAAALKSFGGIFGSAVPAGDIAGAVLAGTGVVRKVIAEWKRIQSGE